MSDVSSGGVFLKAQGPLSVGQPIELFLAWPALRGGRRTLRLVIRSRILRSSARGSAVGILRYEHRLRPKAVQATHPLAMAG
jgi:hypothetical protein